MKNMESALPLLGNALFICGSLFRFFPQFLDNHPSLKLVFYNEI